MKQHEIDSLYHETIYVRIIYKLEYFMTESKRIEINIWIGSAGERITNKSNKCWNA